MVKRHSTVEAACLRRGQMRRVTLPRWAGGQLIASRKADRRFPLKLSTKEVVSSAARSCDGALIGISRRLVDADHDRS